LASISEQEIRDMTRFISSLLLMCLVAPTLAMSAAQGTTFDRSPEYWYAYASKLPIGATVRVRTTDGKRHTAVLALVDASGIALELKTRIPEPARRIPYNELTQLELANKNGSNLAKAVAVGAGVGGGIFFVLVAILASSWD
jgi:hypothetical protein